MVFWQIESQKGARARSARAPLSFPSLLLFLLFCLGLGQKIDLGRPGLAWVKPQAGPGQALGWAREALGTMGFSGWGFLDPLSRKPLIQKTPCPENPLSRKSRFFPPGQPAIASHSLGVPRSMDRAPAVRGPLDRAKARSAVQFQLAGAVRGPLL